MILVHVRILCASGISIIIRHDTYTLRTSKQTNKQTSIFYWRPEIAVAAFYLYSWNSNWNWEKARNMWCGCRQRYYIEIRYTGHDSGAHKAQQCHTHSFIHSLILFFSIWRVWRHRIWRAHFVFNKCPWQPRRAPRRRTQSIWQRIIDTHTRAGTLSLFVHGRDAHSAHPWR